jgi:hypothetical protein
MIPMKSMMLAGAAMLSFATMQAIAQDTPPPPPAAGDQAMPPAPPADPAAMPTPPAPPAGADPNAGQPTGAVPPATGMAPASPNAPKDPSAPVGSSANPVQMGGNMTPPPAEAKDYPVCSKTVQDSCINPGEAHRAKRHKR